MRVGVVKETKPSERRVGLTPSGAGVLIGLGHDVLVETGAGAGGGFDDAGYEAARAIIVPTAEAVWEQCELIVKVKEPTPAEYRFLRPGLTLFTYLHLAANRSLTAALVENAVTGVAYETVRAADGHLPLLAPMSEIAGRVAAQAAAHLLLQPHGGPGLLMGGAPGVRPARVLVVGGGTVGAEAAAVARGIGADVVVLERSLRRIHELERRFEGSVRVLWSDDETLLDEASRADAVVGAVLIPGGHAPRVLERAQLRHLKAGATLLDVAIDQGGCFETSRPTTHEQPTFTVDGVPHYCVANIPGAVPVTATRALTNATLPYVVELAEGRISGEVMEGVNTADGEIVHPAVAAEFPELPAKPLP